MKNLTTFPIYSLQFWKSYLIHMRPYLLFISGIAGVMGMAFSPNFGKFIFRDLLAFFPFFLGYGFGQALTDCFQTDTDKLSSPYRPLSQGIVSIRSILLVSLIGLMASGFIFYFLNVYSFYLSLVAVVGLGTYSWVKKNLWFAGPFYNAAIVSLLPVMGFLSTEGEGYTVDFNNLLIPVLITFFSYTSFVLIGYLKDIEADSATGYKTFPVVFGWDLTVLVGDFIAMISLVLLWLIIDFEFWPLLFAIVGTMITLIGQVHAHLTKEKNEIGAQVPIISTVRAFILFHESIILSKDETLWGIAMLYYLLFELVLFFRPSKNQI